MKPVTWQQPEMKGKYYHCAIYEGTRQTGLKLQNVIMYIKCFPCYSILKFKDVLMNFIPGYAVFALYS